MESINIIAQALRDAGGHITPLALAELAWLAETIGVDSSKDESITQDSFIQEEQTSPASVSIPQLTKEPVASRVELQVGRNPFTPITPYSGSTVNKLVAASGDLVAPRSWLSDRALRKALHNLGNYGPGSKLVIDLEATVHITAQTDEMLIIQRYQEEPAAELLIVEDRSIAMAPFAPAVFTLVERARGSGRFKRVIHLGFNGRKNIDFTDSISERFVDPTLWPLKSVKVKSVGRKGCPLLVIVVSDGLDPAASNGHLLWSIQRIIAAPARAAWLHPWGQDWGATPAGETAQRGVAGLLHPGADIIPGIPVVNFSVQGLQNLRPWLNGLRRPKIAWMWQTPQSSSSESYKPTYKRESKVSIHKQFDKLQSQLQPAARIVLGLAAGLPSRIDIRLLQVLSQIAFGEGYDARVAIAQVMASGLLRIDPSNGDRGPVLSFFDHKARKAASIWTDHLRLPEVFDSLVRLFSSAAARPDIADWGNRLGLHLGIVQCLAEGRLPNINNVSDLDENTWEALGIALHETGPDLRKLVTLRGDDDQSETLLESWQKLRRLTHPYNEQQTARFFYKLFSSIDGFEASLTPKQGDFFTDFSALADLVVYNNSGNQKLRILTRQFFVEWKEQRSFSYSYLKLRVDRLRKANLMGPMVFISLSEQSEVIENDLFSVNYYNYDGTACDIFVLDSSTIETLLKSHDLTEALGRAIVPYLPLEKGADLLAAQWAIDFAGRFVRLTAFATGSNECLLYLQSSHLRSAEIRARRDYITDFINRLCLESSLNVVYHITHSFNPLDLSLPKAVTIEARDVLDPSLPATPIVGGNEFGGQGMWMWVNRSIKKIRSLQSVPMYAVVPGKVEYHPLTNKSLSGLVFKLSATRSINHTIQNRGLSILYYAQKFSWKSFD